MNLFLSIMSLICLQTGDKTPQCARDSNYTKSIRISNIKEYSSFDFFMCKKIGIKCDKLKTEGCYITMNDNGVYLSAYSCESL